MIFGLTEEIIQQIKSVISSYPVINPVIFGSRAMERHEENSDIDISVSGELDSLTVSKIRSALNELSVPYKFDVVHYESINNPDLKDHIDRVGKPL